MTEIAALIGVTRQRVYQLTAGADFPPPAAVLAMGNVWEREAIEEWARRTGRSLADAD